MRYVAYLCVLLCITLLLVGCGSNKGTPTQSTSTISPQELQGTWVAYDKSVGSVGLHINMQDKNYATVELETYDKDGTYQGTGDAIGYIVSPTTFIVFASDESGTGVVFILVPGEAGTLRSSVVLSKDRYGYDCKTRGDQLVFKKRQPRSP